MVKSVRIVISGLRSCMIKRKNDLNDLHFFNIEMADPYYEMKLHGWKQMMDWIGTGTGTSNTNMTFKEFCRKNYMDYIQLSAYIPYLEKMESYEKRLAFVKKQINKSEELLNEHSKSKNKNEWCDCPKN